MMVRAAGAGPFPYGPEGSGRWRPPAARG